jgi:hypothetical protein
MSKQPNDYHPNDKKDDQFVWVDDIENQAEIVLKTLIVLASAAIGFFTCLLLT